MAEAEARLVGTIEEWQDLGDGQNSLSYIHRAAELLANDLVQLLAHNRELRSRLQSEGNRLSLSLVIKLDEARRNNRTREFVPSAN
ncbi:hypothetical protein LM602_06410 [Candidatus Acetothermia bacterium]|jgi:hypothetical protein|nr:hypothetical protein [Candidatus Acetothermia bacterium]MCI2436139.1 hypothetical protein [Candidatus Acetothermia bacterium]